MNLMIIRKNNAIDPKAGFLTKSVSKPYDCATAMPPAWELSEMTNFTQSSNLRIFHSYPS